MKIIRNFNYVNVGVEVDRRFIKVRRGLATT